MYPLTNVIFNECLTEYFRVGIPYNCSFDYDTSKNIAFSEGNLANLASNWALLTSLKLVLNSRYIFKTAKRSSV